ncbi:NAD(P)H-dependent oxidoreductase [Ferruginibacter sp. HRS2-29]|uniref:NAD(P)H-dependent oxidoreductase n=1 Tax=Ferruginibacter sp. HRS2-29 TaxID=2487334 RepID=UPI0020CE6710|nr:NAD(P)H-dependent oxidoreductase [Ferruginibacter sp. HRS2-29]MCP9752767.1 NAD(P)H-dependent oxidoreductase [Ferruginibacter sp. HRS2-29]
MSLVDSLNWRYAAKRMSGEKISETDLESILEATRLSASSMGLQPYTIMVISNPEVRAKLQAAGYNQPQIVESSHLLLFTVWDGISEAHVDVYIRNIAQSRGVEVEDLKGFSDMINGKIKSLTPHEQQEWAARQVYIALGTALAAAAELRIDATPMEGFSPEKFDEILGLKEKGLKSVVMMAIGYRSSEDTLAGAIKVRRQKEALFSFVD